MKNIHRYAIAGLLIANILLLIYTHGIGVSYELTSLVETDPARYVHQARQILEQGRMPDVDMLRSAPLGEKTGVQLTLYPYVIAGIYHIVEVVGIDFEQLVVALPILFFVLSILTTYLLVWRIFGHKVALLSVNILVLTPPLLVRTYAGFADRDGLVLLLSMLAFFFYVQSYYVIGWKQGLYLFLSSITMLCIGLTWQGVGLFVSIIITVEFIKIMVDKQYNVRTAGLLGIWMLPISLGLLLIKFDVYSHLSQPYAFMVILYPICALFTAFIRLMIQYLPYLNKTLSIGYRIPAGFGVVLLFGLVSLPLIFNRISEALIPSLTNPFGKDTVLQVIGELQKLGPTDWVSWPGAFLIPITIGLLLVFGKICNTLDLPRYWTLTFLQLIVLGIAFSRLLSDKADFAEDSLTLGIYFISLGIGILGVLIGYFYSRFKRNSGVTAFIENQVWISVFLVIWTLGMLVALRAAARFAYLFTIPSAILGSYAILWPFEQWIKKDKQYWIYVLLAIWITCEVYVLFVDKMNSLLIITSLYILMSCIVLCVIFFTVRFLTKRTLVRQLSSASLVVYVVVLAALSPHIAFGGYAFQIKKGFEMPQVAKASAVEAALIWIRDNTPQNSVIAADWEHGGWINLLSNRATIVDEQQRLNWVHQMAKCVFMADNDIKDTLEFLKTHKATYLFIPQRNINILDSIASEAGVNYGINIPVFGNIVQNVHLMDKVVGTDQTYYRYWLPDWQQYTGDYELKLGDKTYLPNTWYITSIYIQNAKSDEVLSPIKAVIELSLGGTIMYLPPENINYNNVVLNANKTSMYLPCTLIIDNNQSKKPKDWHIVYLSPQMRSLLTVRLFVFNELETVFERVYPSPDCKDPSEYAAQVWKIHYPPGIKTRPEYLEMGSLAPTNF